MRKLTELARPLLFTGMLILGFAAQAEQAGVAGQGSESLYLTDK